MKKLLIILCAIGFLFDMVYPPPVVYATADGLDSESAYPGDVDSTADDCTGESSATCFDMQDDPSSRDVIYADHFDAHSDAIIELETKLGTGSSTASDGTVMTGTGAGASAWAEIDPTLFNDASDPGAGQDEYCLTYEHTGAVVEWQTCGSGGGDSVTVNSTAIDTTADFADGDIDFSIADGGAGGPDTITATVGCTACIDATDMAANSVDSSELVNGGVDPGHMANDDFTDFSCDGAGACTVEAFSAAVAFPGADGTVGQLMVTDGAGTLSWASPGATAAGGSDTEIQYNNSGVLGGVADFILNAGGDVQVPDDDVLYFGGVDAAATPDWYISFDSGGENRLEFISTAAAARDVYFDLNDNNTVSTFYIENSDATYAANLDVEGSVIATAVVSDLTGAVTGNADTATALAANGANCSAGEFPLGVDASGAVETCTDAATQAELNAWTGSANITTLGTIGTGTWQGTAIANDYIPDTITLANITQITSRAAENLSSSCTNEQVLGGDGASGVHCQTDDDVPEAGDVEWDYLTDDANGTYTDGKLCTFVENGDADYLDCQTTNVANAAGSDTNIQYNDGGTNLGGIADIIWDDTNFEFGDERPLAFGGDADWLLRYNETGTPSDQILISTTKTASSATDAPMVLFFVDSGTANGTNMTADQDVFAVVKGTQSTHFDLLVIDEDGDVDIAGDTTVAGTLSGMTSVTVDASATPTITFTDSNNDANGTADITAISSGAYDILMTLAVDVAGTPTDFIEVDGVSETVDLLKAVVASDDITISAADPDIILDDTGGADGFMQVAATDADDSTFTFGVDDSDGDDQVYLSIDGVNERVLVAKDSSDDNNISFAIRGDADSDAGDDTAEALTISLTTNATPTSAVWNFASTQGAGYNFEEAVVSGGNITSGDSFIIGSADIEEAELEILDGSTVTTTELEQLATIGATTISAAQWTGLGGATTAGIALWDDAAASDQRTTLGLAIGTNVQAYDADLTTYAGITPSANMQSFLDDADFSTMRTTMGVAIGTDVLAEQTIGIADNNLLEVDQTTTAADNEYARFTANGLESRSEAEFKGDFNLEAGTDFHSSASSALNLATTGTILGAVKIVTTTDGAESTTTADQYGTMYIADNATAANDTDYTLSSAAAGMAVCFYDNGAGTGGIIVDAATGDTILLDGTALAGTGYALDSPGVAGDGANGDFICLVGLDADTWVTMGASGTWVDGGAD